MAKDEKVVIHVLEIHHRHGTDIMLGWTKKQVTDSLYAYIKQWWSEWDFDMKLPRSKKRAIDAYFDGEHHEEWCDIHIVEMPPKP